MVQIGELDVGEGVARVVDNVALRLGADQVGSYALWRERVAAVVGAVAGDPDPVSKAIVLLLTAGNLDDYRDPLIARALCDELGYDSTVVGRRAKDLAGWCCAALTAATIEAPTDDTLVSAYVEPPPMATLVRGLTEAQTCLVYGASGILHRRWPNSYPDEHHAALHVMERIRRIGGAANPTAAAHAALGGQGGVSAATRAIVETLRSSDSALLVELRESRHLSGGLVTGHDLAMICQAIVQASQRREEPIPASPTPVGTSHLVVVAVTMSPESGIVSATEAAGYLERTIAQASLVDRAQVIVGDGSRVIAFQDGHGGADLPWDAPPPTTPVFIPPTVDRASALLDELAERVERAAETGKPVEGLLTALGDIKETLAKYGVE